MLKLGRTYSAVLLAFISFTSLVYAQVPTWPIDAPAFVASAGDIQAAAARIKPEPFTNGLVPLVNTGLGLDAIEKSKYSWLMASVETSSTRIHSPCLYDGS